MKETELCRTQSGRAAKVNYKGGPLAIILINTVILVCIQVCNDTPKPFKEINRTTDSNVFFTGLSFLG